MIKLDWTNFKSLVDAKSMKIQESSDSLRYRLFAFDGPLQIATIVFKDGGADQVDYETNYAPTANQPVVARDTLDNMQWMKRKLSKDDRHFEKRGIQFTTKTAGSLFNELDDGTDAGDAVLRFFKADGTELTQGGLTQAIFQTTVLDVECAVTTLDMEPTYNFQLMKGDFRFLSDIAARCPMHVLGAPDIPSALGGHVSFVRNIDLQFIPAKVGIASNGESPREVTYDPVYHTGLVRMIMRHGIGVVIAAQVAVGHYHD